MITDLPQGYKSSKNLLGTRTKYDKLFQNCNENLFEKSYMYLPPYFNDRVLRLPGTFQTRWPDTLWTGGTLDTHPSAHPSVDRTKPNNKATVWTQYLERDDRFNLQVYTSINHTNISFDTCSFFDGRSILTSAFILLSKYGLMVSLNTQAHL